MVKKRHVTEVKVVFAFLQLVHEVVEIGNPPLNQGEGDGGRQRSQERACPLGVFLFLVLNLNAVEHKKAQGQTGADD